MLIVFNTAQQANLCILLSFLVCAGAWWEIWISLARIWAHLLCLPTLFAGNANVIELIDHGMISDQLLNGGKLF
jgi:hypothetical protein